MYNNREQIPEFVNITTASGHDSTAADSFPISSGSVYAMDKGYICFKFFQKIARKGAYFVTRTKTNTQYRKIGRRLNTQKNIRADWIVELTGLKSKEYPEKLRIIRSYDHETKRVYEFLTNNFKLSAQSIADVYKARWDIELFFRWIKQNLKIKTFIGTSENAVMIQIWTAMIACLLTVYMRFKSRSTFSLLNVFRLISDNLLFSIDIFHLLSIKPPSSKQYDVHHDFQLAWNF
jgi:putative transposase